jgi:hypothetical protein
MFTGSNSPDCQDRTSYGMTVDLVDSFGGPAGWADGDFSGNGRVDLHDFAIIRGSFGWVATAPVPAPTAPPQPPVSASVIQQPPAEPDSVATGSAALAADLDISAALPSPGVHVTRAQPLTTGLTAATLHSTATPDYDDLRTLGGDPPVGSASETDLTGLHSSVVADDPLADLLAESPLDAILFLDFSTN